MLKKIKKPSTLIIMTFYVFGMFLMFSGDLITQIQKVKFEIQIQKIKHSQNLYFTLQDWNSLPDKEEIKYKNAYYDVISFDKTVDGYFVKVIRDHNENEYRLLISQILKKNKYPPIDKKKNIFLSKHIVQENKLFFNHTLNFQFHTLKNYVTFFDVKTKSFIDLLLDPPIEISFF